MSTDEGRVTQAEVVRAVAFLHGLAERAAVHEQTFLFVALNLAAESLADNAETATEMDGDADVR